MQQQRFSAVATSVVVLMVAAVICGCAPVKQVAVPPPKPAPLVAEPAVQQPQSCAEEISRLRGILRPVEQQFFETNPPPTSPSDLSSYPKLIQLLNDKLRSVGSSWVVTPDNVAVLLHGSILSNSKMQNDPRVVPNGPIAGIVINGGGIIMDNVEISGAQNGVVLERGATGSSLCHITIHREGQ